MYASFDDWLEGTSVAGARTYEKLMRELGVSTTTFSREASSIVDDLVDAKIPRLVANDIVYDAKEYIAACRARSERPLAILWDAENVPIPSSVSGLDAARCLKAAVKSFGVLKQFNAYMSVGLQLMPESKRSDLQLSGCHLIDTPHLKRKEVADKMIIVDAMSFALEHPDGASICVVTADQDYAYLLSVLKKLPRFHTVIIAAGRVPAILFAQADAVLHWSADVLGIPLNPDETTDDAVGGGEEDAFSRELSEVDLRDEELDCLRSIVMRLTESGNRQPLKSRVVIELKESNPVRFASKQVRDKLLAAALDPVVGFLTQVGTGGTTALVLRDLDEPFFETLSEAMLLPDKTLSAAAKARYLVVLGVGVLPPNTFVKHALVQRDGSTLYVLFWTWSACMSFLSCYPQVRSASSTLFIDACSSLEWFLPMDHTMDLPPLDENDFELLRGIIASLGGCPYKTEIGQRLRLCHNKFEDKLVRKALFDAATDPRDGFLEDVGKGAAMCLRLRGDTTPPPAQGVHSPMADSGSDVEILPEDIETLRAFVQRNTTVPNKIAVGNLLHTVPKFAAKAARMKLYEAALDPARGFLVQTGTGPEAHLAERPTLTPSSIDAE